MALRTDYLYLFFTIVALAAGLSPEEWRAQSIYQVVTDRFARSDGSVTASCDLDEYCGGTWRGLIQRLDYIQEMGFTAVWISPVVKNPIGSTPDGNSYHGYWAQDAYAVNPQFGTPSDLKALSAELHNRGMYLMVDVVPNHMGSYSSQTTVDYSQLNPFNDASYFHSPCSIDYNNATSVVECWIGDNTVALPDLKTESAAVQSKWNGWISELVSNYSSTSPPFRHSNLRVSRANFSLVDGLRIDTAYEVDTDFWAGFQAAAGGIHTLGEVWQGDPTVMCPYQDHLHGLLNYGTYYWITQAFASPAGSIANLANGINQMKSTCRDVTLLGSFIENHDNPRFPSMTRDPALIRTAIAFALLADGIPIVYQGQEQGFTGAGVPQNREPVWTAAYNQNADLYRHIRALNALRSRAIAADPSYLTYMAWPIYSDAHTIVMRKGFPGRQVVSAYTNQGSSNNGTAPSPYGYGGARPSGAANITIAGRNSGFTPYECVTEVLRCHAMVTDSRGNLGVGLADGGPVVLYPTAALGGSGICGL